MQTGVCHIMNQVYPKYFEAFKPRRGLNLNLTGLNIIVCCLLLFLVVQYSKESIDSPMIIDTTSSLIGLVAFCVIIYRIFFEIEKPNHKSIGLICFHVDSIKLNSEHQTYYYEEISEFNIGRVRGEANPVGFVPYPFPCYTSGQDTNLILTSNNNKLKVHLRLNINDDKQAFEAIVRDQFTNGRIELNKVLYGLDLNYEEVQNLKRTAHNKG